MIAKVSAGCANFALLPLTFSDHGIVVENLLFAVAVALGEDPATEEVLWGQRDELVLTD
jgi:hypothetical protein